MIANRWKQVASGVVIAALVVGAAVYVSSRSSSGAPGAGAAKAPRYHCPMHPTMVSDQPGDCPICGMRLVPIEESEADPPEHDAHAAGHSAHSGEHGQQASAPAGKKKVIYRSTMNPN